MLRVVVRHRRRARTVAASDGSRRPPPGSLEACIGDNPDRSTAGVAVGHVRDNLSSEHVRIYWLDYEGDLVLYNDLDAGESYLQGTWLTHPWVAINDEGNCTSYFIVDEPTETWDIGGGID